MKSKIKNPEIPISMADFVRNKAPGYLFCEMAYFVRFWISEISI